MIKPEKLQFWIANRWNVLFEGKHGVGKTAQVIDAFNFAKLRWKYFSAATMDPWVDFIGVPKEKHNSRGQSCLELIRPEEFQEDQVEALFFDEFNRAHKKVRNAVMELLQFKSINGKKFNNLKVIWAAINPADENDTYDVEPLDPAQKDRFHIHVSVPYEPDLGYFNRKFGDETGRASVLWWDRLPEDQQKHISPRRLDYAVEVFEASGDLRDVLPTSVNVPSLISYLTVGPIEDIMCQLMDSKDIAETTKYMADDNFYRAALGYILGTSQLTKKVKATAGSKATLNNISPADVLNFFLPYSPKEKLAALIVQNSTIANHCLKQWIAYRKTLITLFKAGCNKALHDKILAHIQADTSGDATIQEVKDWITAGQPPATPQPQPADSGAYAGAAVGEVTAPPSIGEINTAGAMPLPSSFSEDNF